MNYDDVRTVGSKVWKAAYGMAIGIALGVLIFYAKKIPYPQTLCRMQTLLHIK